MANQGRVRQRLREMACVAFLLRNRERAVDLLDAGDHATFRQQAVQFFGPAPANVDPQDYIAELQTAVQTQKSFYVFLSKYCLTVGGVTDLTIRGVSDARRAKQRKNFLFLAREGADDSFATAYPDYFPDGNIYPGPNGELFDAFADWTMREHPGWTTLRDIDDHCGRREPWEAPAWVLDMLPPIVALVVAAASFVFVLPFGLGFFDLITFRPNPGCVELVRVGMCEYYGFGQQARAALFDPSSL